MMESHTRDMVEDYPALNITENKISFSKITPIALHVHNLSIIASKTGNRLMDSFSVDLGSGSVMAIMGGSGSGKTTLLNVLASKISGGLKTEGSIKYVFENEQGSSNGNGDGNSGKVEFCQFSGSGSLGGTILKGNLLEDTSLGYVKNQFETRSCTCGEDTEQTDSETRNNDEGSNSNNNNDNNNIKDSHTHVTMAYLPQTDVLPARLTCRETLMYAADLKLNKSKEEKRKIVNQLLDELGLRDCADTLVGDNSHRGLSGGEKRRLSIGTQMISNPSIMFLDEPTTGLDAYSAYLVVKTIKKLAQNDGRIFVMSIHQPRSDILFLFDKITILSKGKVVYCDNTERIIPYFASLGYDVPPMVNPADYFIDISSINNKSNQSQIESQERLEFLVTSWREHERRNIRFGNVDQLPAIKVGSMNPQIQFFKQVLVLTRRAIKLNSKDYLTLVSTILEPVVMGTILGWIFYKPDKTTPSGLRTLTGALYSSAILQAYLYLLFDTYRLCEQDISLFDRERAEGSVSPLAFVLARKLSLFLTDDVMMPLIFTVITYFMFGLEANAKRFFLQFSVIFLTQFCSSGLAMLSVAISRDFSKASTVGNLAFTLVTVACGYFVNSKTMPVYVRWTKYISFGWCAFGSLVSMTYSDAYCNGLTGDECVGNQMLMTLGFPRYWQSVPITILFCWGFGFLAVGVIILYINKVDITLQNEVKPSARDRKKQELLDQEEVSKNTEGFDSSSSSTKENKNDTDIDIEASVRDEPLEINIELQNISLHVSYLRFSGFKRLGQGFVYRDEKQILNSISATFKAGVINAIMGPSGSGKSTLLNLISGRVNSTLFSKFDKQGTIKCNGRIASESLFRDIHSYVSQDDDHLLAKLTVRETFRYAADLRLHHLTPEQREARADKLIRSLGLKHCENNIIGDEFVKGISGGEKRRVSMGIQLLNDAPILLLDEPTSGLDSFTSSVILEILEKLAREQRKTVILTIHQPRAELFKKFGNVLLLAQSGRIAFNGSPDAMIEYFKSLGYQCPSFTNVADFFLDLISVNIQNEQNEAISRERVEGLLSNWRDITSHYDTEAEDPTGEMKQISADDLESYYSDCIKRPCSDLLAYTVNCRRQLTTTRRSFDSLMARMAQVPGLGAIFAVYFAPLKNDYIGVANRLGLAQESTCIYFVGMLANLACYPHERNYFYKEYEDNVYGIGPFFMAYLTLELPLTFIAAIIYAILTVLACGLPRTAGNFFATVYCAFLVTTCGESLGIITNTFFERPGFVVNCISIILSIGTVMAGLMSLSMSRVLKGFNYLNPVGYTSLILINLAFPSDLRLTCDDGGRLPDGSCEFSNGSDVLRAYNLVKPVHKYLGIITCVALIYRLLAFFTLKAKLKWVQW